MWAMIPMLRVFASLESDDMADAFNANPRSLPLLP
jgi:hypothetical protein